MDGFGLLILLGILKWIGIVLLALLLLLLLLVLVVLLSPIRYWLEGEKKAELGGAFGVSWLFGAVKAEGVYTKAESLQLKVKLLWFTILGGEPKEEKKPKKEKKAKGKAPKAADLQPDLTAAEKTEPKMEESKSEEPKEKPKLSQQRMEQKQPKTVRRVKLSEMEEKPPLEEEQLTEKEEAFFKDEEAAEEKKEKIPPIVKEILKIEDKKGIFQALAKLLKRLVRGILPGNLFLKGTIGTGDPTTTGYVLALAGMLTAKFGNDIQIRGDFTKAAAEEIEVRVKGRIILGGLVWAVLAFILTKPVLKAIRKMITFVLRQRKAEKGKGE